MGYLITDSLIALLLALYLHVTRQDAGTTSFILCTADYQYRI